RERERGMRMIPPREITQPYNTRQGEYNFLQNWLEYATAEWNNEDGEDRWTDYDRYEDHNSEEEEEFQSDSTSRSEDQSNVSSGDESISSHNSASSEESRNCYAMPGVYSQTANYTPAHFESL